MNFDSFTLFYYDPKDKSYQVKMNEIDLFPIPRFLLVFFVTLIDVAVLRVGSAPCQESVLSHGN